MYDLFFFLFGSVEISESNVLYIYRLSYENNIYNNIFIYALILNILIVL